MPEISLTSFVDFVSKSGRSKLTVLRKTKKQIEDGYGPEKDFYKRLREALVEMHRASGTINDVSSILPVLTDQKKMALYPKLIDGYRRWSGRKGAEWFEPDHTVWRYDKLGVRINPELGLAIKGIPHLIKLYFKQEPLSKSRIDVITHLMSVACAQRAPQGCVMGVLDVRQSKLIRPTVPIEGLDTMLRAEAAYWITAWDDVG